MTFVIQRLSFRFLMLGLICLVPLTARSADETPPNVILILSDDQAWGDYSFMGHPYIQTPHIDRLAKESVTFTRGYVPSSLCRPSLSTIITGKFPHQHGIVGNDPPPPPELSEFTHAELRFDPRLYAVREEYIKHIDNSRTLPAMLHDDVGVVSFQTGKWWEGNYARGGFTEGMTHGDMANRGRHGDAGLRIGRHTMRPMFEFMNKARKENKPFFVWYAPIMPHSFHNPPEHFLEKYRTKTPHIEYAKYWAMCEWFDETVGHILNYLDRHQIAENTMVVYVTDNGWINMQDADAPAPRSKNSPYDGGTRTPIMVRWPGQVAPQMNTTSLASSIDLVPTILAATGANVPEDLPGINLLDRNAVNNRKSVFGEIFEHDVQDMVDPVASLRYRWVVSGDWKLILPVAEREPKAVVELFKIVDDPYESKNLAEENPDVVAELTKQINDWWPATPLMK